MMVTHANRRTVVRVRFPEKIERTDPRLVSLPHDKVYFVPERRLVWKEVAKKELAQYKDDNANMMRS